MQVYKLTAEGIAFRFLPDPAQIKNAIEVNICSSFGDLLRLLRWVLLIVYCFTQFNNIYMCCLNNVGDVVDTFSLDRAIELDYHLVEFDDVRYHIQMRVRAYFYAIQTKCR